MQYDCIVALGNYACVVNKFLGDLVVAKKPYLTQTVRLALGLEAVFIT